MAAYCRHLHRPGETIAGARLIALSANPRTLVAEVSARILQSSILPKTLTLWLRASSRGARQLCALSSGKRALWRSKRQEHKHLNDQEAISGPQSPWGCRNRYGPVAAPPGHSPCRGL